MTLKAGGAESVASPAAPDTSPPSFSPISNTPPACINPHAQHVIACHTLHAHLSSPSCPSCFHLINVRKPQHHVIAFKEEAEEGLRRGGERLRVCLS